jgi:hypothetical protein
MLREVLSLLETRQGGLGAAEISQQLMVPAAALEGMLETLVQRGRLRRLRAGDPACAGDTPCGACPLQPECNLLAGRGNTRYVVVPRPEAGGQKLDVRGRGLEVALLSAAAFDSVI